MPDFGSFNILQDGATYIHSNINNFNQVYNMNLATFDSKWKPLYFEMLEILELRIKHLKSLRVAYASIISPNKPDEALSILNDLYNKALKNPDSLLGSSLLMKELSTYYKTTKKIHGDEQYFENYRKQVTLLLEAFNNYKRLSNNYQIQAQGAPMMKLADRRLIAVADDLDNYINKYIKENKALAERKPYVYRYIFEKIRKKKKNIKAEQAELFSQISIDGAIGFTREVGIAKMTDELFKNLGVNKGEFVLDAGAINNVLQRADTFETIVSVEEQPYAIGFNVKSFAKGYKGTFVARDFSSSLKNKNKDLYSYWAYLSKNIGALQVWDSNLFGESFRENQGTKWEKRKPTKVNKKLKSDLLQYEAMFSQIFNLAGFLDGFLEYTKEGKFVPQPLDKNYEKEKGEIKLYEQYIYSVALAMQDQVFWVDELLQSIYEIFAQHIETFISTKNANISVGKFSSKSTIKEEKIFSEEKRTLVNIYRQKLKKIKKAAGNYSTMASLVSDFSKFKDMKINNIRKNLYTIDPYTLSNVRVRRINIDTVQFE